MRMSDEMKRMYLDYAASTPVDTEVEEAMRPYWSEVFGNAGGQHEEGRKAREAVEGARARVAEALGSKSTEIIFTSGGTESNNQAIFGLVKALRKEGRTLEEMHAVTLSVEHPSVLDCFQELEEEGLAVSYLPVDAEGLVSEKVLQEALRPETVLVSIAYVNSEIGTVQPIAAFGSVIAAHRKKTGAACYFHTDASQAPVYFDCAPDALLVDMVTLDAQKMYGPKGIGILYVRDGVPLASLLKGGSQERGVRPGTPNTPLIVGFAESFTRACGARDAESIRVKALRDLFIEKVRDAIPEAEINGTLEQRTPNNISVSIPGVEGDFVMHALDARGIACSTRSACFGAKKGNSHVVAQLGKSELLVRGTVRFTLGKATTRADIEKAVDELASVVVSIPRAQAAVAA